MKKLLHFKVSLFASVMMLASLVSFAQNYEANKTLNKSVNVSPSVIIDMQNSSGDLKFVIGDNNTVSMKTEVHVDARSEEDAQKLIKAIEDFEFDLSGNRLSIDTRFYKSMNSVNNKTTVTLNNGDKIHITDFEISHEISMPKSAQLELENKYSDVVLPDLEEKAEITLYSGKMMASDFNAGLKLASKYSKITAGNFIGNTDIELYDTDIEFRTSKQIKINSKYSKVEADKTGTLECESYDDKFFINEIEALKLNAKYSDLESKAALRTLDLDLYDCVINVKSAGSMNFNGKYSKLKVGDVKTIKVDDMYDSNITCGKTESIEIGKSKYSEFVMEDNKKFEIGDSYDDDVQIGRLTGDFSGISINGKYTKLNVSAGSAPFRVDVMMKYGKVDLPSSVKIKKQIEKNSEVEIVGNDSGGTIMIRGYDNTVVVR